MDESVVTLPGNVSEQQNDIELPAHKAQTVLGTVHGAAVKRSIVVPRLCSCEISEDLLLRPPTTPTFAYPSIHRSPDPPPSGSITSPTLFGEDEDLLSPDEHEDANEESELGLARQGATLTGIGAQFGSLSNKTSSKKSLGETLFDAAVAEIGTCYRQLKEKLKRQDEPHLRFAPIGTAQDVLDKDTLRNLFRKLTAMSSDVDGHSVECNERRVKKMISRVTSQDLHQILATMLFCRSSPTHLIKFLESTFDAALAEKLCLPMDLDTAISLFGPTDGASFYDDQFIFAPLTLVEGQENKSFSENGLPMRLPFLSRKRIGGGAFGDVYEVIIAIGGWMDKNKELNQREIRIAQKVAKPESLAWEPGVFERERDNLFCIGQDPSHQNLQGCLASLETSTERSLFSELAEGNLEQLLTDAKISRFSPAIVFRQAAGMCSGMDHLHQGLSLNGQKVVLYHLDFTPQNVLIFSVWKITDFGLSKIKYPKPGSTASPQRTRHGRGVNTFDAPEAFVGGMVNCFSDLWSLGAVLLVVITYSVGGPELVADFNKSRGAGSHNDRFFTIQWGRASVNKKVTQWCKNLRKIARQRDETLGDVVHETLTFIERKVLVVNVRIRRRTSAGQISDLLDRMSERLDLVERLGPSLLGSNSVENPDSSLRPNILRRLSRHISGVR